MGNVAGKNVHLTLWNTDVSAYVTAIHMMLKGHGLVDVTGMGSTGHKWASDELQDDSFTVDFLFESALPNLWETLDAFRLETVQRAVIIGPQGTTGGMVKVTGDAFMEDLPMEVAIGDMIRLTGVPFRFHDGATVGTYP